MPFVRRMDVVEFVRGVVVFVFIRRSLSRLEPAAAGKLLAAGTRMLRTRNAGIRNTAGELTISEVMLA